MSSPNWQQLDRCAQAKHPQARLCRFRASNGALHTVMWCYECQRNVTAAYSKVGRTFIPRMIADEVIAKQFAGTAVTWDTLPVVNHEPAIRVCYLCSRMRECEDHHLAEQAIYEELAHRLPIVALCKECHGEITKRFTSYWKRSA